MNGITRMIRKVDTGSAGKVASYLVGALICGTAVGVTVAGLLAPFWWAARGEWGTAFLCLFLTPIALGIGVALYAVSVDLMDNAEGWYDG